jgi:hypothetical protein
MSNDNSISPSAEHSGATNFSEPSGAPLPSDKAMRREVAQKFREVLASFKPSGTAQDQRARVFIEAEVERLEAEVERLEAEGIGQAILEQIAKMVRNKSYGA